MAQCSTFSRAAQQPSVGISERWTNWSSGLESVAGLDVDTRSIVYELLTGTTPFERQLLEQAAYDEIRRIVREKRGAPSTKIST